MDAALVGRDLIVQARRIVAELVGWRDRHGHYPKTLHVVNNLPDGTVTDPFAGMLLIYN